MWDPPEDCARRWRRRWAAATSAGVIDLGMAHVIGRIAVLDLVAPPVSFAADLAPVPH